MKHYSAPLHSVPLMDPHARHMIQRDQRDTGAVEARRRRAQTKTLAMESHSLLGISALRNVSVDLREPNREQGQVILGILVCDS